MRGANGWGGKRKRINTPGTRYGTLTLVAQLDYGNRNHRWSARCDCGRRVVVWVTSARQWHDRSRGRNPRCAACSYTAKRDPLIAKHPREYETWTNSIFPPKLGFAAFLKRFGAMPRSWKRGYIAAGRWSDRPRWHHRIQYAGREWTIHALAKRFKLGDETLRQRVLRGEKPPYALRPVVRRKKT